jgi:NAD+ kinase
MSSTPNEFQHILIATHPQIADASDEVTQIVKFFKEQGVSATQGFLNDEPLHKRVTEGNVDLLIALGGDGTMLRAGQLCGPPEVPILGINMGKFGFLTEVNKDQWHDVLPRLFEGDYWLENRMMLRNGEILGTWDVLNEIVVTRGHVIRPVHLRTHVDGLPLTTFVADGMIAATATGSTAYALAAGGPILPPELRNILLVAVAPHLSVDRAIVLAEGSTVSITVHTDHQAVISPDGQTPIELMNGDRIDAYASEHTVQFVRFQDRGYFYRNITLHMSQNPSTGNHR